MQKYLIQFRWWGTHKILCCICEDISRNQELHTSRKPGAELASYFEIIISYWFDVNLYPLRVWIDGSQTLFSPDIMQVPLCRAGIDLWNSISFRLLWNRLDWEVCIAKPHVILIAFTKAFLNYSMRTLFIFMQAEDQTDVLQFESSLSIKSCPAASSHNIYLICLLINTSNMPLKSLWPLIRYEYSVMIVPFVGWLCTSLVS